MTELLSDRKTASAPAGSGSLRSRAFRAGRWVLLGNIAGLAIRFIGTVILTRIFNPEVFGIVAIITSVQVVVTLLTDVGLRQAVIQSANGGATEFLRTAFTFQILRGAFIWLLCVLLSFCLLIAIDQGLFSKQSVYADPMLPIYLIVASLSSVVMGFQSMRAITAARDLQIERVSVLEFLVQLLGLLFLILVGWWTRSIWCYVLGLLFSAAITVVFSHTFLKGPSDRLGWNRASVREIVRFGRWTFLSSLISAFAINGDRLLLGSLLNAQNLGFYSIAYNLVSVPESLATRLFGAVAFPALSEAFRSNPERLPNIFLRMRLVSDAALLFVAGLLFASGPAVVALLYDPRYAPAGWMLQYLSFSLVFMRYGLSQSAYLALGHPEYAPILSTAKLVSLCVAIGVSFYWFGVKGAVIGVGCHMFLTALCTMYLNKRHRLNSLYLELSVLPCWFVGWLVGFAFLEVLTVYRN